MKIKIVTHFATNDFDFTGDYCAVSVYFCYPNGDKLIKRYGDYYHDKGDEKSEGFIDGVSAMDSGHQVIRVQLANFDLDAGEVIEDRTVRRK